MTELFNNPKVQEFITRWQPPSAEETTPFARELAGLLLAAYEKGLDYTTARAAQAMEKCLQSWKGKR